MASTPDVHRNLSVATTEIRRQAIHANASTASPLLNTDKATDGLQRWPTSPKRVKSSLFANISNGVFDVVLLACSVAFLAFALIVNHYDQASTPQNLRAKRMLENATKYGPTVFPILFASVIGRAAHSILLWRLEKGERIGMLDTLAASTSLTSTVTSQFQLRMISLPGVLLVALWALSPVGGQASIRQMSIETTLVTEPASFRYMAPNGHVGAFQASDNHIVFGIVNTIFTGAMVSPWKIQTSPLDTWGNVKIPKIERYEKRSKPDPEGWYDTGLDDDVAAAYTSFVGIPIDGNAANAATTDYSLRLQTPYLNLQCTPVNVTRSNGGTRVPLPKDAVNQTGSGAFIWWSLDLQGKRPTTNLRDLKPFNFTYAPNWGPNLTLPCTMTSTYVETEVTCIANSTCRAAKVRRSQLDSLPPAWTPFDIQWQMWNVFTEGFLSSLGDKNQGSPSQSLFDRYLSDPQLRFTIDRSIMTPLETYPSDEEYSDRFGQLLNSYFNSMNGIWPVTGGITNVTSYFWDTNITFVPPRVDGPGPIDESGSAYNWTGDQNKRSRVWPSEGTKIAHVEIIMAHKPWVVVLSVVSVMLIISSLVSPFVRFFLRKGPDVAMNISSLATRNNPYILLPANGTFLDAADRAKLLRDSKIRFGDVDSSADVGSLAIGSCSVGKASIVGIHKGRLYE